MDPDSNFFNLPLLTFLPSVSFYFCTFALLFAILLNAIISGSEVAFFALTPSDKEDVRHRDDRQEVIISRLLESPERLLLSIIIAYNLLNVIIVCLTVVVLHQLPWFYASGVGGWVAEITIALLILLVFIEIIPKLYASGRPLQFAKRYAKFIAIINTLFRSVSYLLIHSSRIGYSPSMQRKSEISMDDLSRALEITSNEITHEQEKDMLEGIIRFKDTLVSDIMVPRTDMFAIDQETAFDEVIRFIVDAGFSRIPVYEEDQDKIVGILYVKDLLPHLQKDEHFEWQKLIRPAYFVPGTKRIDDLLEEFRTNKNHMAIIVDEYGGTTGLITMEDILEEIVGDISDEYDEEKAFYTILPDGSYLFEGKTTLEDFFTVLNLEEGAFGKSSEEVDTLAGLILELKGDFPKEKEKIVYGNHHFDVEEMGKNRIEKIKYSQVIPPENSLLQ